MIRRALFKGALAMIPGGLPPRRIDQLLAPSEASAPSPATPGTVRRLIIGGTGSSPVGWFIYNGTPAAGNPPVDYSVPNGVLADPFGNALPGPGIVSNNSGIGAFGQLFNGNLILQNSLGDNWRFSATVFGGVSCLTITGPSGTLVVTGAGFTSAANPSAAGPEIWHPPVTSGFGTVAGAQPVEYQLNANGMVEITGAMAASGAYTGGTTIWTIPAAYRPATNTATVGVIVDAGGALSDNLAQITPAGAVMLVLNVAAAAEVFFTGGAYRTAL